MCVSCKVLGGFLLLISCVFTLSDCILPRPRNHSFLLCWYKEFCSHKLYPNLCNQVLVFLPLEKYTDGYTVIHIYIPYQGYCIFISDTLSVDINSYCLRPFPSTSSKSISALGLQTAGLFCKSGLTKPPKSWKPIPPTFSIYIHESCWLFPKRILIQHRFYITLASNRPAFIIICFNIWDS